MLSRSRKGSTERPRTMQRKKSNTTGEEGSHLLFVQIILCVLIGLFVFFAKSMNFSFIEPMRKEYQQVMTKGVAFSSNDPMVRFASDMVKKAKGKMQDVLGGTPQEPFSEKGAGGFHPVKNGSIPDNIAKKPIFFVEPLTSPVQGTLTSSFGFRENPVNHQPDFHHGIDLAAPEGAPVYAARQGIVIKADFNQIRGNYVIIRHADGVQTRYQHLSYLFVREGQVVQEKEQIGTVGKTGMVTGPHLHWEVQVNGFYTDPEYALRKVVTEAWQET